MPRSLSTLIFASVEIYYVIIVLRKIDILDQTILYHVDTALLGYLSHILRRLNAFNVRTVYIEVVVFSGFRSSSGTIGNPEAAAISMTALFPSKVP